MIAHIGGFLFTFGVWVSLALYGAFMCYTGYRAGMAKVLEDPHTINMVLRAQDDAKQVEWINYLEKIYKDERPFPL